MLQQRDLGPTFELAGCGAPLEFLPDLEVVFTPDPELADNTVGVDSPHLVEGLQVPVAVREFPAVCEGVRAVV